MLTETMAKLMTLRQIEVIDFINIVGITLEM
jgi:hypothetical protein